jgi:FemAB-related protein (PEP-CTERM system-associated)
MEIIVCQSSEDAKQWDEFVENHAAATNYHRWNWKRVLERAFSWPTFYLMAKEEGRVRGILPLAWQKSWIFHGCVSSLPVLSTGGIVAETPAAADELLEEAKRITRRVGAKFLELRYRDEPVDPLQVKNDKVTVVRPLSPDSEKMWAALGTKIRTKIRKAINAGMTAEFAGAEFLDEFYALFCENMRDLGTPVYGRSLFREILAAFPKHTHICIVRLEGRPIATSFLTGFRDTIEAKWSASVSRYLALKPNMFLYWNLFCFAGRQGYKVFDFGRSTPDSGTHVFKMQWGSETIPLHWAYWLPSGREMPQVSTRNPKYQAAIRIWQKLPVALTRTIGPTLVRHLPS